MQEWTGALFGGAVWLAALLLTPSWPWWVALSVHVLSGVAASVAALEAWFLARGYLRLLRARRTLRIWSTRCLHRESGCHTCGGAPGEPCDPYTHEFAASGTAAGRDAAEVRRDNRIATRDAKATGVVTTFPAITAYREAARTGDWAAFAAKDLRPVTLLARDVDDAEARRGPWSKVAAAEHVNAMNGRRGRTG